MKNMEAAIAGNGLSLCSLALFENASCIAIWYLSFIWNIFAYYLLAPNYADQGFWLYTYFKICILFLGQWLSNYWSPYKVLNNYG